METRKPGESVGVDTMDIYKSRKIIVLIDYFTRKIFARIIRNVKMTEVEAFLKGTYPKFPFESIITDNGKEFINHRVTNFLVNAGIKHVRAISYHHQSNGRVERAIRALRTSLKKIGAIKQSILNQVVENYNLQLHRGLEMTPYEAVLAENWDSVYENCKKYAKGFLGTQKFNVADEVLIRREIRKNKMDNEFEEKGKVLKV